jgi:hypothetical protein
MNFNNDTLNLALLWRLQKIYAEINVQLVVETQKIAQVILRDGQQTGLVLAEIEDKR